MLELKNKILSAGVVGAGGAGFPTHVKFCDGIETILINGTECEPLLKTDFYLLKTFASDLEKTLNGLIKTTGAKRGVIGIKKHTGELLEIADGKTVGKVTYKYTPNIYPAGDEIILIKETLDLAVPAGNLPISVGVVVLNVETLLNIKNALSDKGVYEKYLTVGGNTDKTYVMKVPVGTPVSHIFKSLGIEIPSDCVVLDGGPMMGRIINPNTAVVTKTTKGLLIIEENTLCIRLKRKNLQTAINHASSNCCGCRMCTDMCPRYLMGYPIEPHKIIAAVSNKIEDTKTFMGAFYCSDCGVCRTIACTQNIVPSIACQHVKGELAKQGIRAQQLKSVTPRVFRDYRKIPIGRVINKLGISKHYRDEFEFTDIKLPKKVFIGLKQHIGAPAVACVKEGDKVKAGQIIANAPEKALGTNIHSSVDGTVYSCTETGITITLG